MKTTTARRSAIPMPRQALRRLARRGGLPPRTTTTTSTTTDGDVRFLTEDVLRLTSTGADDEMRLLVEDELRLFVRRVITQSVAQARGSHRNMISPADISAAVDRVGRQSTGFSAGLDGSDSAI